MAYMKQAKTESEIKGLTLSKVKVAYNTLAADYNRLVNLEYIYCPCCGEFKASSAFYTSHRTKSGYEHLGCRACILDMATDVNPATKERKDNREKTIEVFRKLDLPFIEKDYDAQLQSVIEDTCERVRSTAFQQLLTMVKSLPQYRRATFKDSKFIAGDPDNPEENTKIIQKTIKAAKKRFGPGYTDDDYMFLENEYQSWITRYECSTKVHEDLFEMLCINKWDKRKALHEGKPTKDLDKTYQDLLSSINLLPRQSSANGLADSLTFGQLIEKWEEEEPIPEPSEEFKDVDGIGKYIRVWFKGHLARALGLDNGYSREYDEYVQEYRVTRPEYFEDGKNESIYSSIFGESNS